MTTERTLAIIKPGAVMRGQIGVVVESIVHNYFTIREQVPIRFTEEQAKEFYKEHAGKPFFDDLIAHTCSGPCLALVLEGDNAVDRWRALIGPTAPAACGREHLRWHVGAQLPDNGLHGSATFRDAEREIGIVFPVVEQKRDWNNPKNLEELFQRVDDLAARVGKLESTSASQEPLG